MSKTKWLAVAEVIDSLRIFPRLMVLAYGIWVVRFADWFTRWYEHIPTGERNANVTAFASIALGGVFGLSGYILKIYLDGGRDWNKQGKHDADSGLPQNDPH